MAIDPGRVKALFQAAIERADLAERRAFLDREIGDDAELRERLDALMAAHERPPGVLDRPLDADVVATLDVPSSPDEPDAAGPTANYRGQAAPTVLDTVIAGRYKIRQEIGEGGMGSVYLAEQLKPVRRQVALKLIKPGMDSRTVLARFESERQALALMDHPHIAKVLDAGTTEQGRPYFVMELVKGIPLTDYCDRHHLGLPERLTLFRQICSAVQHAHQKGIIHRDLKPTNILVESHDGHPVPKVIDFGLAKATSGMPLTEQSLFTAFGSVTGTPLYMAPEQASFNAIDVDTRADIYALGVILYELLTGSTPIHRDTMKRAALDEMLRVIREDEPPTPSSRISTSDALPSLAANRHIEPTRLSRFVRGDLDWIVMKALAKERNRRYDSAIGLANDIERFTNHEPVSAGPPSSAYRMRKFVRRNRGQVVAASLILIALLCGVAGTTLGLIEARRQERKAQQQEKIALAQAAEKEKARQAEAAQKRTAETRKQQAEKRLAQVTKMNEILGSIFQDLDPKNAAKEGKPLSAVLGERLDRATTEIEGEATGDPLTVARMQTTLGLSQLGLGYADKAIGLFGKARATFAAERGPDHPETLNSMNNLANSYDDTGQRDRALWLREEVVALREKKLGPDHPDTLSSMNNLSISYFHAGQRDQALKLREEVLALRKKKLGPDHPDTLMSMNNLAFSYFEAGQRDMALKLREEVLASRRAKLGPDHPYTLNSMNNLAISYFDTGKREQALKLREETLALRLTRLGPDHPDTLASMQDLAISYSDAGQSDRGIKLFEEALVLRGKKLGPDHPETLNSMYNLAVSYSSTGQRDRGIRLFEEVLALQRKKLGPDNPDTLQTIKTLAQNHQDHGEFDRAEPLWDAIVTSSRKAQGDEHYTTLAARLDRADLDQVRGRLDDAESAYRAILAVSLAKLGPDHDNTDWAESGLAAVLEGRGDLASALPLRRAAVKRMRRAESERMNLVTSLVTLAADLLKMQEWAEAESTLREALKIREAAEPVLWTTFNTRAKIGRCLLGQKKYAEAEPFLRSGYDAMKARADKIPPEGKPRLVEALDALISLAEATGKPDEVAKWKDEKARLTPTLPAKPEAVKK